MENTTPKLSAEELLHLAMESSKKDNTESAITYLKRAIELKPEDGRAHYLLAAEHAQIGMYDQAVEEMEHAVRLDPTLHTASFQLGLIHLTSARIDQAIAAWAALNELGENNFLYLFKTGLEHLIRDEFDQCVAYLERGIKLNNINLALNNDMQRVITSTQEKVKELGLQPPPDDQPPPTGTHHAFISAYTNSKD